jgi:DNA-binding NarL/FixJ family response regulator
LGPVATEEEAVTLARRARPDIVLVEIELGRGSSGISVVRRILDRDPETAVIYVTDRIDRLAVRDLRNVAVIEKPVDKDEIEHAIRQADRPMTGRNQARPH